MWRATLGYALMIVMDEDDLGHGPCMECQKVNIWDIDYTFMKQFIKGTKEHRLQNHIMRNAIYLGVHKVDIDLISLCPLQEGLYTNLVKWMNDGPKSIGLLYNGNHQFSYIQDHSQVCNMYVKYQHGKQKWDTKQDQDSREKIEEYHNVITMTKKKVLKEGIWLVKFVDLGEWS